MSHQFWRALGRAIAHVATSIAIFILSYFGSRYFGADQIVAQAIGILAALAPGCYDYLGRDLIGQEIKEASLLPPDEYSVVIDGKTVTRSNSGLLNDSDFRFISDLCQSQSNMGPDRGVKRGH